VTRSLAARCQRLYLGRLERRMAYSFLTFRPSCMGPDQQLQAGMRQPCWIHTSRTSRPSSVPQNPVDVSYRSHVHLYRGFMSPIKMYAGRKPSSRTRVKKLGRSSESWGPVAPKQYRASHPMTNLLSFLLLDRPRPKSTMPKKQSRQHIQTGSHWKVQ
jgi:hypothetical protein